MVNRRAVIAITVATLAFSGTPAGAAEDVCAPNDPFSRGLAADLAAAHPNQRFTAAVLDLGSGCQYDLNRTERITTASVFKIEIMAGVLWRAQQAGRTVSDREMALLAPMMTESADPPANQLFVELGSGAGFAELHEVFGLTRTDVPSSKWGATATTARDQINLVRQVLIPGTGPLMPASQATARRLMTSVIPEQAWGISAGVPIRWQVALKNGFYPGTGGLWRINSVGLVEDIDGRGYLVAILSTGWAREADGIAVVEAIARRINSALVPLGLSDELPFVDVGSHDWFARDVAWAREAGVTRGTGQVTFDPFEPVSRGQAAAFLARFLGLSGPGPSRFTDVDASGFEAEISAIGAAGITLGCDLGSDRFCPERAVTRGEFAAMLERAFVLSESEDRFVDDNGHPHEGALNAVGAEGWLLGCEARHACPNDALSRAELVAVLHRVSGAASPED